MPKMDATQFSQIFKVSEETAINFPAQFASLAPDNYNLDYSYEDHFNAAMWVFRPSAISKKQIDQVIAPSDPHFRCSSDPARRALSKKAAAVLANAALKPRELMAIDKAANDGVGALDNAEGRNARRLFPILRVDTEVDANAPDPEAAAANAKDANEFNKKFLNAFRNGTPAERGQLLYEEFESLRKDLGIMEPHNTYEPLGMSDEAVVDLFPKYFRYLTILGEMDALESATFTAKQTERIKQFKPAAQALFGILLPRVNIIANPTYEFVGPELLYSRDLTPSQAGTDVLENADFSAKGDGRRPGMQPIQTFLSQWLSVHNLSADIIHESVCGKDPALASATWSVEPNGNQGVGAAIAEEARNFRPVMARLRNGDVKIVSSPYDTKAQSLDQYLGALSAIADKSNRFLLTGSKQFDAMDTTMKNMLSLAKSSKGLSGEDLEKWMKLLQQRAQTYLEYKGYNNKNMDLADGYDPVNLPASKNNREKSRIELAATLIKLTRAHAKVREKTKEMDKKLAEQKEAAKKKAIDSAKNGKTFTLTDVENFYKNANGKLHFIPKDRVKNPQFQLGADTGAGLSDFAILALFCAASPDTRYKLRMNKDSLEYTEIVNNPDKAYPELLSNVLFGNTPNYDRDAIASASGLAQRCKHDALKAINAADAGNFEQLGKLVADGLKQNTKLLNNQKAINNNFIAYADINTKALEMMERNPALKEAVTKNMTPEELNAAKAAAAMAKVHLEGLKSFDKIAEGKYSLSGANEKDLINVFQMSYVDNQFASKTVLLEQSPYGSDPALPDKINALLVKNIDIPKLILSGSENIQALLNNRNKQSELCNAIILESQKTAVSNSAPQVEKQINKEAEANKENEGKVIG